MRKTLPLISNQDFLERIQSVCPIKTQIISIYDCYHCGCQCIHSVGWNGGRIIRQTSLYEFVVFCPKGYLTLIEYSFDVHDVRSILSTKTNNHAALAQMEERQPSKLRVASSSLAGPLSARGGRAGCAWELSDPPPARGSGNARTPTVI